MLLISRTKINVVAEMLMKVDETFIIFLKSFLDVGLEGGIMGWEYFFNLGILHFCFFIFDDGHFAITVIVVLADTFEILIDFVGDSFAL